MIDLSRWNPHDLRSIYVTAKPFPHVVLDNFCESEALNDALKSWPKDDAFKAYQKKKQATQPTSGPLFNLLEQMRSRDFLAFLETVTGIPRLIVGPDLAGGGIAEVARGGSLGMHLDHNQARFKSGILYRRLNVMLYLNPVWEERWMGAIKLVDNPKSPRHTREYEPIFNRLLIFESSERSWHGHPHKLDCPEFIKRRYAAVYAYTKEEPPDSAERHTTIYADRT